MAALMSKKLKNSERHSFKLRKLPRLPPPPPTPARRRTYQEVDANIILFISKNSTVRAGIERLFGKDNRCAQRDVCVVPSSAV
jgi:hypothetical protein